MRAAGRRRRLAQFADAHRHRRRRVRNHVCRKGRDRVTGGISGGRRRVVGHNSGAWKASTLNGLECQRVRVGVSTFTLPASDAWRASHGVGDGVADGTPRGDPLAGGVRRDEVRVPCAAAIPMLFPFAGRCHVGGAPGWWIDPDGVKASVPAAHGLVRQGVCEIVESGDDAVAARFVPASGDAAVYPYSL